MLKRFLAQPAKFCWRLFSPTGRTSAIGLLAGAILTVAPLTAEAQTDLDVLRSWGEEVYQEIDATLRVSGTSLYAESASLNGSQFGGSNGKAYVWPASTQFRVFTSLTQIDSATYTPLLRQFSDELRTSYWNNGYQSGAGGGTRFYDDNAHLVIALAEAYRLTEDRIYLRRAIETQAYVMSGEDSAAGGGIYFHESDFNSKDTISTLQGARGAAMLYEITGQQSYLDDATRLLSWTESHVQLSNGLYHQRFDIGGNSADGVDIVNSAGIGISTNLELYHATNDSSYLTEAQRVANQSITRFFDSSTGRINDEGYWAYELIDGLNDLYLADENPYWLDKTRTAMTWLHDNKRDANGHYDLFWGRNGAISGTFNSWHLNEQAAVARVLLDTSITILPGDVDQDGVITLDDVTDFVNGWLADTSELSYQNRWLLGDLNVDGITDLNDFSILRQAVRNAGVYVPQRLLLPLGLTVPEPSTCLLMLAGLTLLTNSTRRRCC